MTRFIRNRYSYLLGLLLIVLPSAAQNMKQVLLVDRNGNEMIKTFPEEWAWTLVSDDRIAFKTDPDDYGFINFGFVDSTGKVVIKSIYAGVGFFSEGLAPVAFIQATESKYSSAEQASFTERIIKWGYIDKNGKTVIPPAWDEALSFYDGFAAVCRSGKWGFINKKGKTVVPPKYDNVSSFHEGLASVTNMNKYSVIDTLGNELIPFRYSRYGINFNERLARAHDEADPDHLMWGYIDLSGNWVIGTKFEDARDFRDSIAPVETNDKWGFIDHKGEFVIPPVYRWVYNFSEGLCAASDSTQKWGFIDAAGNVIVPFKYTDVREFSEGLAAVKLGYRWGFINKKGEMVIEPRYGNAWYFQNGWAEVEK